MVDKNAYIAADELCLAVYSDAVQSVAVWTLQRAATTLDNVDDVDENDDDERALRLTSQLLTNVSQVGNKVRAIERASERARDKMSCCYNLE